MNFRDFVRERVARSPKAPTYSSLNEPILLLGRFRFFEIAGVLVAAVFFGILQNSWSLVGAVTAFFLGASPALRRRSPPGRTYRVLYDRLGPLPVGLTSWGRIRGGL